MPRSRDTFAAAVAHLERRDGLVPVYVDRVAGRILVALKPSGRGDEYGEFLYQVYLRSGIGSTPVGLDRSAPAATQLLVFRRSGRVVYAELQNTGFRADGGSDAEQGAVHDSFAPSTIWSGNILAQGPDGSVLLDLSSFLLRDAFGVIDALATAKQGKFQLDPALSHVDVDVIGAFPKNVEFEAHETFTTAEALGSELKSLVPAQHEITLVEHQSLIQIPEPGFQPRRADPRTGAFGNVIADYSAALGRPVVYRLANRFRLEKIHPGASPSPVRKPIVFYVDRAAPEPIRAALVEGAQWWADAFAAAGFTDAFRVEVLPEGVSPLDARYNVINWVHRQTRGWSYGQTIIDPRSGEIVKGAVSLGSLRVRQDLLIFEGLAGTKNTGSGTPDDPIVVALARLRQLAAHETGHALGLEHNFAGSSFDDRGSVMDYPAPRIKIAEGRMDFADAYQRGVGSWDRFAIHWLYDEVAAGEDPQTELDAIVREGYANGLRFVADDDARPVGSSHPHGALWDDGPDPVTELRHVLDVRRLALSRFGTGDISKGQPLAELRRLIVPVYLFHRYEVDAVAKSIGGADFVYASNGDGVGASMPVSGAEQRRSLDALLATLDPAVLDLPDDTINLLSAGEFADRDQQTAVELFGNTRGPAFSLSAAAEAAADITLGAFAGAVAAQPGGGATSARSESAWFTRIVGEHRVCDLPRRRIRVA